MTNPVKIPQRKLTTTMYVTHLEPFRIFIFVSLRVESADHKNSRNGLSILEKINSARAAAI
jgi:hypothetical protein